MRIRTRMAPSPTGEYHVGHMRTLLYNWALARQGGGQFIIRIEDTDQERKVPGAVEAILSVIRDYGFTWDEGPEVGGPYGPYVQSERLEIYRKYARELVDKGAAYYCFCSKERLAKLREEQQAEGKLSRYDGECREIPLGEAKMRVEKGEEYVVRLKVPSGEKIEFEDLVMGKIVVESDEVDDQVLLKADGFPTYHLGVVVDDHLMEVSHVLRGSEWISSTPKHILLYEAFGWQPPTFGHLPVLLDPGGGKMSKRKGSVSAKSFLEEGYLPEAIINFLALLGWTHPEEEEIFSREEFVERFEAKKIHKVNPVFDRKKLDWMNGVYIRSLDDEKLVRRLEKFKPEGMEMGTVRQVIPLVKDRIVKLSDFAGLTAFLVKRPKIGAEMFEEGKEEHLRAAEEILSGAEWNGAVIDELLQEKVAKEGWKAGKFFMNLRVAICGSRMTPPLTGVMLVLGREETMVRIQEAKKV